MSLNRRDFTRLAAATAAASLLPSWKTIHAAPRKKIGYCAVGLGRISVGHFMPGTRMSQIGEITALVSGDPTKARKLAAEYNIPESSIYSYADYDKIRDNPGIDAVYIGLPNSMHAEYTIRAAQAGKHVLCEKPMANTVAECQSMIDACKHADRKLMIAYRLQLQSTFLHAQKLVRSGAIGKVQAIESCHGFNIAPGEWRLNRKLSGGGPLMDVGIYSLNACRFLLGEEPTHLSGQTSVIDHDGRFDEVEETVGWTMRFPSGAIAACTTTYGASMEGFTRLHGSRGVITINGFGYQGIQMTAHLNGAAKGAPGQTIEDADTNKDPAQFLVESDYFSQCIAQKTPVVPSGEEGLRDVDLMMKIYASAAATST